MQWENIFLIGSIPMIGMLVRYRLQKLNDNDLPEMLDVLFSTIVIAGLVGCGASALLLYGAGYEPVVHRNQQLPIWLSVSISGVLVAEGILLMWAMDNVYLSSSRWWEFGLGRPFTFLVALAGTLCYIPIAILASFDEVHVDQSSGSVSVDSNPLRKVSVSTYDIDTCGSSRPQPSELYQPPAMTTAPQACQPPDMFVINSSAHYGRQNGTFNG